MAQPGTPAVQLIDGRGAFNEGGLEAFCRSVKLAECGLSYAVVAIMGPQSSGKSTLMNHLFKTKFVEMDAFKGRTQTTQGVWMARAEGLDPCTLVMDLEGTDGRERGEDDTAFEKQSSLFALAVSDIVLINMWCHDIGREHAANKPLLKTVFQVMMRLFTPRKATLLFVIRDKTRTPLETLEPILREDIQKIWEAVPKPAQFQYTPLSEFFNVQVTALANFEEKEEQFKEQVAELRKRFHNSVAPGGLAGDRRAVIPGTGFPLSTQHIWKIIKENKDLDLPAHKVMVATVRCEEIAHEKLQDLVSDQDWLKLEASAREGGISGFGKKVSALLEARLSEYDAEAAFFEEGVRSAKRIFLVARALDVIYPSYQTALGHHRVKALSTFKHDLDMALESPAPEGGFADVVRRCTEISIADFDGCCADAQVVHASWDTSKSREKLRRDIDAHAQAVRTVKLLELTSEFEKKVQIAVVEPAASLLDAASPNTWPEIGKLLKHEVEVATSGLSDAMAGFEPTEEEEAHMLVALSVFARNLVEKKAREEAGQVIIRMKDRFNNVFGHDEDSMPRVWGEEHDVRAITRDARDAAVKLLAVLAALRVDPNSSGNDGIESALLSLLGESQDTVQWSSTTTNSTSESKGAVARGTNLLATTTWPGISPTDTLLTPAQCRNIWRQFKAETEYTIGQALAAQEASRRGKSWLPPPWAMLAMVVLGFNEFMTLLRNPMYIAILFVLYLLGKAMWVQLDIAHEFQHGFLTGFISVSTKLLPTMMNLLKRLVDEGQRIGMEAGSSNSTITERIRHKEAQMQEMVSGTSSSASSDGLDHPNGDLRQRQQVKVT